MLITCLLFGTIKLLDYGNNEHKSWSVNSDCEPVRIRSTIWKTEIITIINIIGYTKYSNKKVVTT